MTLLIFSRSPSRGKRSRSRSQSKSKRRKSRSRSRYDVESGNLIDVKNFHSELGRSRNLFLRPLSRPQSWVKNELQ